MNNLNLVVMGKTGSGKSTLINAVLEEDLAPTGIGQAVTKKNQVYSKSMLLPLGQRLNKGQYILVKKTLNLYDTVGLEIDSKITQSTLHEIKGFIKKAQANEETNDLTMVWFCVSCRSSRFEKYEIELIRSLSIEHEIPFMLVLTQCYTDEKGELEKQIKIEFPEIPVIRILAKEYKLRSGTIPAYGIVELLQRTVWDYDKCKVRILEAKLNQLLEGRKKRIEQIRREGTLCVEYYSDKAMKKGYVPGLCIPFVHGTCIKMLMDLDEIVGIDSSKGFASEIFANTIVGLIATPFMAVPILSSATAYGYVASIGENYLESLMAVVEKSTDEELKNNELMAERIKTELKKRKK